MASSNNNEYGTIEGGGHFISGDTCTVKATASEGYEFVNWTENGAVVSTTEEYTFIVGTNRNLVANFQ